MIKNLFTIVPLLVLMSCSDSPLVDEKPSEKENATEAVEILTDYEAFYDLFETVDLPYQLNYKSIYQCSNGHFSQNQEQIADGNVIEVSQLNYLINQEAINKDHAYFIEWCTSHIEDFDDDWLQIMPGVQFSNENNRFLTIYTYAKENNNCDGFWEVLLIKMTDNNEIVDFKRLGLMGYTSFLDAGEEKGAKYHILNVDHEYFIANFTPSKYEITLQRWSTKKGQDWRVDQNLKVDDSVSSEDVVMTHNY